MSLLLRVEKAIVLSIILIASLLLVQNISLFYLIKQIEIAFSKININATTGLAGLIGMDALPLLVGGFITFFFFKKWKDKLVAIIGIMLVLVFLALPFLSLGFTFSYTGSFSLIRYIILAIVISCFIYSYFRDFSESNSISKNNLAPGSIEESASYGIPVVSRTRIIPIVMGFLVFSLIGYCFYLPYKAQKVEETVIEKIPTSKEGSISDQDSQEGISADKNIGRVLAFDKPLMYTTAPSDSPSKAVREVGRQLSCITDNFLGSDVEKGEDVTFIPFNQKFEVVKMIEYGHQDSQSKSRVAVLKDKQGILSTMWVFTDDSFVKGPCINDPEYFPYTTKLLRFIDKNTTANVIFTLDQESTSDRHLTNEQIQSEFISMLKTLPAKYVVNNIQPVKSPIPTMLGVAVTINADALIYLSGASHNLAEGYYIYQTNATDKAFLDTLIPEDLEDLETEPPQS